jgi:MFS family permease
LNRLRGGLRTTFVALEERNFRLFFIGQAVSICGSWMQMIAQAWLVLELTGNGAMLGLVTAMQWIPLLLFGAWGGVIADRSSKRAILLVTEVISGVLALALGLLVLTDVVQFWMVLVLAGVLGLTQALGQPARQSIVSELVGPARLTNGLSLTSLTINVGRLVGPAMAGLAIAAWDMSVCFLVNALTYIPSVVTLALISSATLYASPPVQRAKGQFVDSLRYVHRTPILWVSLCLMIAIGTFTYEFQVTLPLLASITFGADAAGYGFMQTALGVGAILGGFWVARQAVPTNRLVTGSAVAFGVVVLAMAVAPTYAAAIAIIPLQGAASIIFSTLINSSLQLSSEPAMRSRIMALFTLAFMGTTPIGGPFVGWIAQTWSPRWAFALGGVVAIGAGAWAWRRVRHLPDPSTTAFEHHHLLASEPPAPVVDVDVDVDLDELVQLRPRVA